MPSYHAKYMGADIVALGCDSQAIHQGVHHLFVGSQQIVLADTATCDEIGGAWHNEAGRSHWTLIRFPIVEVARKSQNSTLRIQPGAVNGGCAQISEFGERRTVPGCSALVREPAPVGDALRRHIAFESFWATNALHY